MITYILIYLLLGLYFIRVAFLQDKTLYPKNIPEYFGLLILWIIWPLFTISWILSGDLTFKTLIAPITYFFKN